MSSGIAQSHDAFTRVSRAMRRDSNTGWMRGWGAAQAAPQPNQKLILLAGGRVGLSNNLVQLLRGDRDHQPRRIDTEGIQRQLHFGLARVQCRAICRNGRNLADRLTIYVPKLRTGADVGYGCRPRFRLGWGRGSECLRVSLGGDLVELRRGCPSTRPELSLPNETSGTLTLY